LLGLLLTLSVVNSRPIVSSLYKLSNRLILKFRFVFVLFLLTTPHDSGTGCTRNPGLEGYGRLSNWDLPRSSLENAKVAKLMNRGFKLYLS